jgi:hypothetical protein
MFLTLLMIKVDFESLANSMLMWGSKVRFSSSRTPRSLKDCKSGAAFTRPILSKFRNLD